MRSIITVLQIHQSWTYYLSRYGQVHHSFMSEAPHKYGTTNHRSAKSWCYCRPTPLVTVVSQDWRHPIDTVLFTYHNNMMPCYYYNEIYSLSSSPIKFSTCNNMISAALCRYARKNKCIHIHALVQVH